MSAYQSLCEVVSEIALITSTESVLGWDQETYMPEKALEHRARQLSYLTGKAHGLLTSKKTLKLLERAETEMPSNPTQAVIHSDRNNPEMSVFERNVTPHSGLSNRP